MEFCQILVASLLKNEIHKLFLKLVLQQSEGAKSIGLLGSTKCLYHNVKKTFFDFFKVNDAVFAKS